MKRPEQSRRLLAEELHLQPPVIGLGQKTSLHKESGVLLAHVRGNMRSQSRPVELTVALKDTHGKTDVQFKPHRGGGGIAGRAI